VLLTDTKLKALKPRALLYRIADSGGLCIEVNPSGSKLWRYRYRFAGKASMVALGTYPDVSLQEARQKRDDARRLVKNGANPAVQLKAMRTAVVERAANTFGAIAADYFEQNSNRLTAGTLKRDRRVVERDLNPYVGGTPIAEVSASVLLTALKRIKDRGALETAHRARALAAKIFRYAVVTRGIQNNPAVDLIGALPSRKTEHFASVTEPARVAELLRAIHGYSGNPATVAALKFAPLVFVRPGELRNAKWAEVDLDTAEWRFIASKTKTPHIVPLARQAIEILRELQPFTSFSEYVFPGVRSKRRGISENTITAALRRMGYDGNTMTGHGFRAMARTILDEQLGYRPDFIEHQLAHAVRDPLGRAYNRTAHLVERKKMMQGWADYLDALRTGTKVVPIKRAR